MVTHERSGESGYTLVALAIAVAVLAIMVGAAMPMWSTIVQREKEAELIFRGWQYAEGVRVFQQRHGRLPTRLEELMEIKPRSIRKLWEDPMTEDGKWGLVFQGQQGGQVRGRDLTQVDGSGDGRSGPGNQGRGDRSRPGGDGRTGGPGGPGGFGDPEDGETRQTGPIVGVHSRSTDESIKTLFDERQYDRWTFTVERLKQQQSAHNVGIPRGNQALQTPPRVRWIGRPFREGITPERGRGPGDPTRPGPNGRSPGPNGRGPGRPEPGDAGRSPFGSEGPDR